MRQTADENGSLLEQSLVWQPSDFTTLAYLGLGSMIFLLNISSSFFVMNLLASNSKTSFLLFLM